MLMLYQVCVQEYFASKFEEHIIESNKYNLHNNMDNFYTEMKNDSDSFELKKQKLRQLFDTLYKEEMQQYIQVPYYISIIIFAMSNEFIYTTQTKIDSKLKVKMAHYHYAMRQVRS